MNKRGMSIVGTMGILCLGGFALAPAQAMPLSSGISAIHQIATGIDPLVQVRKKSAKRRQPTSGGRGGKTGSGESGIGAAGAGTGSGGVQLNMTDSDLEQYCFFNGRLFSVGAFFCMEKGQMLQCQVFNKEKDKDLNVGERAWWATMDRSQCSKADQPR